IDEHRRRSRSDSLKKIPTRLFAVWSGAANVEEGGRQLRPQSPMPSVSSNGPSLLAPPTLASAAASSCKGSGDFAATCLRDAFRRSQEDASLRSSWPESKPANYEDFGSPPQSTVEAFDRLDFDANPMDDGTAADFY
uniref:AGC-kinase C-terminal domain-containing protein n=1 Tax=Macrostomum lignano TaxID=282301 RepID=A0A1I8H6M0_9PLAT